MLHDFTVHLPYVLYPMKKHRLVALLQKMTPAELKRFVQDFHRYHAPSSKVSEILAAVIDGFYPTPEDPNAQQALYKRIYQRRPDDKQRKELSDYLSVLNKHLDAFLLLDWLHKEEDTQHLLLANMLLERQAHAQFGKQIIKVLERTDENTQLGGDWFWVQWKAAEMAYFHPTNEKMNGDNAIFEAMVGRFAQLATMTEARYLIELKFRRAITHQAVPSQLNEEHIVARLHDLHQTQQHSLAHFYLSLIGYLSRDPEVAPAYDLWRQYQVLQPLLSPSEGAILFGFMLNAAIRLYKNGFVAGSELTFSIYKQGLDSGLLLSRGYITNNQFSAIVYLACGYGEAAWAEKFIQSSSHLLVGDEKQAVIALAEGEVLFSKNAYIACMDKLAAANVFRDVNFKLRKRNLQIRCLVEMKLSATESLDHDFAEYAKSFRMFLNRNQQLGDENQTASLNFLRIASLIYVGKSTVEAILAEIAQAPLLFNRQWLLEKANEHAFKG